MSELNKKIIELIKENKSLKEIASILKITEKQVYVRIKQIISFGYNLEPSYYYNSDIFYNINIEKEYDENSVSINLNKAGNNFKCLVISDLHIGDSCSEIKLMNKVYEYAIKNGINNILNCGDVIEGDYTFGEKIIQDVPSQIEYFIKNYPYDKSINNYVIFGNHDYRSLYNDGLDISKAITNNRYDIVSLGYGQGRVNIKEDNIILFHKLKDKYKPIIDNDERILLSGHGHLMKTKIKDIFWLGIPTLSYKSNDKTKDVIPGFVELSIDIEQEKFEYLEAKHLIINPNIVQVSESRGKVKKLFKDNDNK